MAARVADLSL